MIEFAAVSKSFGDVEALAPLDLRIGDGEWLGIFGRNGSGKTSLLRILVGLAPPSSGELRIDGVVPDERAWKSFRRRLGYMPERIVFHENLSGRRTIEYYARLRGLDPGQALDVLDRVGLAGAAGRKVGSYSKGMRQRLCFAQALLGDPEILILDEPLDGLDPHGVHQFFALLRGIENRTVVFTSHQLPRFASAVDRVMVLREGHVAALGSEQSLRRRLDLPLRVILEPAASSNGSLEEGLRRLTTAAVERTRGSLVVTLPQSGKLAFLARLEPLEALIDSVRIEEPSLEEMILEATS